jgi:hypothetical protein
MLSMLDPSRWQSRPNRYCQPKKKRRLTVTGAIKRAADLGAEVTIAADGSMKFTPMTKDAASAPNEWDRDIIKLGKR